MNMLIKAQTSASARAVAAALCAARVKHRHGLDDLAAVRKQIETDPELLRLCSGP